jgi:hypothetical protein
MKPSFLNEEDRAFCERTGRDPRQVEWDLDILAGRQPRVRLIRPCTLEDGIKTMDPTRSLSRYEAAKDKGRLSTFVPASGASARMFQVLHFLRGYPEPLSLEQIKELAVEESRFAKVLAIVESFTKLAIGARCIRRLDGADWQADIRVAVRTLFDEMQVDKLPKGILPFHLYGDHDRTAFSEHLVEVASLLASADGLCRMHLTIPGGAVDQFAQNLSESQEKLTALEGFDWEVEFSIQDPATDTPALGTDGEPFRLSSGELLFRPGGHGALLPNLAAAGGDIVLIKNIDNIVPDAHREPVLRWRRALVEELLEAEAESHRLLKALIAGEDVVREARQFLHDAFGVRCASPTELFGLLNRPIRVCGMVVNEGEPGGGPFWVQTGEFPAPQIVEGVQIDPDQRKKASGTTHFNPVELVCSVRDYMGRPFNLEEYSDPSTAIVTDRHFDGRPLRALERPGLWNGGMARWNTVFVEIPGLTFNPVKRLSDLLRPRHLCDA